MTAKPPSAQGSVVPLEYIESRIYLIRGQKVMLDSDLARLYGVTVGRFPADFMFRLTSAEESILKSQNAISSGGHGGRRFRPRVFTEQGVAMLSSVLRSPQAISVNIAIMRAFVKLRKILASNVDLARKLAALEKHYDAQFRQVFKAIRQLMSQEEVPPKRQIGFTTDNRRAS